VRVLEADAAAPRRLEALRRRLGQVLQAGDRRQRRERLRLAVEELGQAPPAPEQTEQRGVRLSSHHSHTRQDQIICEPGRNPAATPPGGGPGKAYALDRELRHEGGHLEVVTGRPRRAGVVGELHLVRRRGERTRRGRLRRRAADVLLLLLEPDRRLLAAREHDVGLHSQGDQIRRASKRRSRERTDAS